MSSCELTGEPPRISNGCGQRRPLGIQYLVLVAGHSGVGNRSAYVSELSYQPLKHNQDGEVKEVPETSVLALKGFPKRARMRSNSCTQSYVSNGIGIALIAVLNQVGL